jgi:hypothetical protein
MPTQRKASLGRNGALVCVCVSGEPLGERAIHPGRDVTSIDPDFGLAERPDDALNYWLNEVPAEDFQAWLENVMSRQVEAAAGPLARLLAGTIPPPRIEPDDARTAQEVFRKALREVRANRKEEDDG